METGQPDKTEALHLHLYNFEEPCYEDSKYVLTSPRSLEACAKVGVKPVDLLYKPLADFQEELLPQDIPLRTIYNIYDEHEKERQRKLFLCREERNLLGKTSTTTSYRPQTSKRTPLHTSGTRQTRKSRPGSNLYRSYSDEEINKSKSSLQRKRTAWASSIGHKRVTKDELNERAKQLHEESLKLRNELLSKKDYRPSRSTTRGSTRPKSASNTPRARSATPRSRSASNLALSGSSCLLNKSTIRDARPITNQSLWKTLSKSMDMKNVCVTPQDQKILELMMAKGEEEKLMNHDRLLSELEWDLQKQKEDKLKVSSEMKRRQLLAEENRIKEMKRMEKERRVKKLEQDFLENKQQEIDQNMKSWNKNYDSVLTMRDLKLSDRKMKDNLKRSSQEKTLKIQSHDEEEMRDLVAQRQEDLINSAARKKEERLFQQNMKKMMENRDQRKSFEKRWKLIEKEHNKAINSLQSSLNQKLKHAEKNYESILLRRDHQIQLSRLERDKRSALAQLSKQKMEDDMDKWRESIIDHRKFVDRKASEEAARSVERKAVKVHDDRQNKEKAQKRNIKKIHQEVEAWRHETEENLTIKEKKASAVQIDKDQTINQSRRLASQSQQLRDQLRERYGAESFDKKAFKAELFNKIGRGPLSSTKNSSKVKLGIY